MAMVYAPLRSLIRAQSVQQAAVTLVAGVKALTGARSAGLGLYRRKTHTLVPVVTADGDSIQTSPRIAPLQISRLPPAWQKAIAAGEPYADADLLRLELPVEVNSQVVDYRTRSFHAEPLLIGHEMVGILAIVSS